MEFRVAAGIPAGVEQIAGKSYAWAFENGGADSDLAILAAQLVDERAAAGWARLQQALKDSGRDPEDVVLLSGLFKGLIWARLQRVEKREELEAQLRELDEDARKFRQQSAAYEAVGYAEAIKTIRSQLALVTEMKDAIAQRLIDGTFVIERDRDNQKAGGQPGVRRELRGFVFALRELFDAMSLNAPMNDVIACFVNAVFDANLDAQRVGDMTRGRPKNR